MTPPQEHVVAVLTAGEVPSRTMLQKLVYFLARSRGEQLEYGAHLYGPYSAQVQNAIGSLVRAKLIDENETQYVDWAGTELDAVQYRYRLTDAGREASRELQHDLVSEAAALMALARRLRAFSPTSLSYAAKVAHLQDLEGRAIPADEGPALAKKLGWKLSSSDVARAAGFLHALGPGSDDRAGPPAPSRF